MQQRMLLADTERSDQATAKRSTSTSSAHSHRAIFSSSTARTDAKYGGKGLAGISFVV